MQEDRAQEPKKQYSLPTLRVYGSIEDLTQAATPHAGGTSDNSRGGILDVRSH